MNKDCDEESKIQSFIAEHQLPAREDMDSEDRIKLLELRGLLPKDAMIEMYALPGGRSADLRLIHRVHGELVTICADCGKDGHELCWIKK